MTTAIVLSVLCGSALVVLQSRRVVDGESPPTVSGRTDAASCGRMQRRRDLRSLGAAAGAARAVPDTALLLDLLAAMFEAGLSVDSALAALAQLHPDSVGPALQRCVAARRLGADWTTASAVAGRACGASRPSAATAGVKIIVEAASFAALTGAPSAALLRSRAAELRAARRRDTERRANALAVRLVLPLGLCQLPAFICLGVVPVVISLLPLLTG